MKTAVITGANGGIGKELCKAFAGNGYFVIATDKVTPLHGDVNIEIDLDIFVKIENYRQACLNSLRKNIPGRGLSALVNNAAIQILGAFEHIKAEDFLISQNVNCAAPFLLSQGVFDALAGVNGAIVNISSIHSQLTKPHFISYATSKAALVGLTQAMAVELGEKIRVNAICPAAIETSMLAEGFRDTPEKFAQLKAMHPVGRIGLPEEVAQAALFLCSENARFINGAALALDGGIGLRLHDPA